MKTKFAILFLGLALLASGCATGGNAAHNGIDYIVTALHTPFYKIGPAQPNGPDLLLAKGDRLTMVSNEFGYSKVTTANKETGYVSTEDLAVAPPEPEPSPTPKFRQTGKSHEPPATREEQLLLPSPALPQANPQTPLPGFRY